MILHWRWKELSREYANFGNPNQWTVSSGLESLAREATQNSNDAIDALGGGDTPAIDFTIIRPTGGRRDAFARALRLDEELRPHLEGMANGNQIVNGVIRDGLTALDGGELLLLRVSDYGAVGLDGPEFLEADPQAWGNFIKLCRTDLFSGKNQAAGGSFGLGKAVYWRFSRFQTALFLSNPADGSYESRLFGVNQGTAHTVGGRSYEARGYFGSEDGDVIRSCSAPAHLANDLCLHRDDPRSGTSALVVGFYDPDNPEADLRDLRTELENGIDESFWPLLARDKLRITVSVEDGDAARTSREVDPARRFPELTRALQRFDRNQLNASLDGPGDVVALPIRIKVPKRKTHPQHDSFEHEAKLVVTLSDAEEDPLENKTALFRKSAMVVQTLENRFPDVTYHAFLIVGAALDPFSRQAELADDFLRYAEPPAHDMWIPTGKAPQTSLGVNYVAPYLPNLRDIRIEIRAALEGLFGIEKPQTEKGPMAILRHLSFLNGKGGPPVPSKPVVDIVSGEVDPTSGAWVVGAKVRLRQPVRPMRFEVVPLFAGEDGGGVPVRWAQFDVAGDGARLDGGVVSVVPREGARQAVVHVTGRTDASSHPVAAGESGLRLEIRHFAPLVEEAEA